MHDLNVRAVNVGSDEMLSVSWTKITLKADPGHLENCGLRTSGGGCRNCTHDSGPLEEMNASGSTNVSAQAKSSDRSDRVTITGEKVRVTPA